MGELDGKVALVTGAGNPRGMGHAIALRLAEDGANVVATDIAQGTPDPVQEAFGYRFGASLGLGETVEKVKGLGREALGVEGDITFPADVERVVRTALDAFGRLDVLVNVAGGSWGSGFISDYDPEVWLHTVKVNVFGTFLTSKYALPHIADAGGGSVVNISSMSAIRPGEFTSAYNASKAAVVAFTNSIAIEWGPSGIRANAIMPGDVQTDLLKLEYRSHALLEDMPEEEFAKRCAEFVPLQRLGLPQDVANLVGFLCSSRASFLTGLAIPLTGGKELIWPYRAPGENR